MSFNSNPSAISIVIAGALTVFLGIFLALKFSSSTDQFERAAVSKAENIAEGLAAELGDAASLDQISEQAVTSPDAARLIDRFSDMPIDPLAELKRLGIDTSVDNLLKLAADEGAPREVRYWGAIALGQEKAPGASELLADLLSRSSDIDLKHAAIGGLAYLNEPASIEILWSYVRHDPSESIRSVVLTSLYRYGPPTAQEIISEAAVDPLQFVSVRVLAAQVLAQDLSESRANTMRVLLVSEQVELRAMAALAMSRDYSDEVMPTLVSSVLDNNLSIHTWDELRRAIQESSGAQFAVFEPSEYLSDPLARATTNQDIEDWWNETTKAN